MIGTWSVNLYDKSDIFIAELPFEGLSIDFTLNDIWTATVRVNYLTLARSAELQGTTVATMIGSTFRYADIKRNDVTVFKGILSESSIQKFDYDANLSITFKGWLAYFQKRYITKTYADTHDGSIAWDMIDTAQAVTYGSIGITCGNLSTTHRDRTYANDEITKNIIGLSNDNIINGYECEISNAKVFTTASRLGSDKPEIVFDEANIKSYQIDYALGLNLTNSVIVLGEGYGDAQLTTTRDADNAYKNSWYLLEELRSFIEVKELTTLQAHGDAVLGLKQDMSKKITITVSTNNISPTDYDVGDGVQVQIEDLIDGLYRIKTKTISVDQGDESVKLTFI